MAAYDPGIIIQFADRLYARADRIVFSYAARGFFIGGFLGAILSRTVPGAGIAEFMFFGAICAVAGTVIGMGVGRDRAFALRLQAQQALCQVQTEANTRAAAATAGGRAMTSAA